MNADQLIFQSRCPDAQFRSHLMIDPQGDLIEYVEYKCPHQETWTALPDQSADVFSVLDQFVDKANLDYEYGNNHLCYRVVIKDHSGTMFTFGIGATLARAGANALTRLNHRMGIVA